MNPLIPSIKKFFKNRNGLGAVEWAVTAPIFIIILTGGYETGRYILIKQKTDQAAFTVGDVISQGRAPEANFASAMTAMTGDIVKPFDSSKSAMNITLYEMKNGRVQELPLVTSRPRRTSANIIAQNFNLSEEQSVVATEVFYDYAPSILKSIMDAKTLYKVSYFRPRKDSVGLNAISPTLITSTSVMTTGSSYEKLIGNNITGVGSSAADPFYKNNILTGNGVTNGNNQNFSERFEDTSATGGNTTTGLDYYKNTPQQYGTDGYPISEQTYPGIDGPPRGIEEAIPKERKVLTDEMRKNILARRLRINDPNSGWVPKNGTTKDDGNSNNNNTGLQNTPGYNTGDKLTDKNNPGGTTVQNPVNFGGVKKQTGTYAPPQ